MILVSRGPPVPLGHISQIPWALSQALGQHFYPSLHLHTPGRSAAEKLSFRSLQGTQELGLFSSQDGPCLGLG